MIRKINISPAETLVLGKLPKGCRQCINGEKLVLFVHGICHRDCFYCPLSEKRKNKKTTSANEAEVKEDKDMIKEAQLSGASGAGITGGEPLINLENTLHHIRLLKKTFGKKFHIHLYTSGDHADESTLKALEDAGLDELRYHIRHDNWGILKKAQNRKFKVGVEIPAIPGELEYLKKLTTYLDKTGIDFLNLNEFEVSELSAKKMAEKGFKTDGAWYNSVVGSKKTAKKLIEFAAKNTKNISVHFCESKVKDAYQFKNRLKRRAKNIRKPFETISGGFLLKKGAVISKNPKQEILKLKHELNLKDTDFFVRPEKNRIEMSVSNAKKASREGYEAQVIEELPSADAFDMEITPIWTKKQSF